MSWQTEVAIVILIIALSLGVTAYVVGLGGSGRRARRVREQLESMVGATVTVVIGTLEDQELQSLSVQARTDGLTGLVNRRVLEDELLRRVALWREQQTPLVLVHRRCLLPQSR